MFLFPSLLLVWALTVVPVCGAASIARVWNEENLAAIRLDFPNPAVHARNLFATSAAMWDAWAAYDPTAVGFLTREKYLDHPDSEAAREEAISYAAFRVLTHRYAFSVNAHQSLPIFAQKMRDLGYDPDFTETVGDSPAALGNRIAATLIAYYAEDGANEGPAPSELYTDASYSPVNLPLVIAFPGNQMNDPNRWQPLTFDRAETQNGQVASPTQIFVASHWGWVRPFAQRLISEESVLVLDPGPPPYLGTATEEAYKESFLEVIRLSAALDPRNEVLVDISPASYGNRPLGSYESRGHAVNPVTGAPYPPNVIPLGDYGRVIAEYWADGPASETPPGHWNKLANDVTAHPAFSRQLFGEGPALDPLEWDVKMYFAMNGATHDAAVAAWGVKRFYDSARPISAIRYMCDRGQSSDPTLPRYHLEGIPLEAGLVELVTAETAAPGGRHEGLLVNHIAVLSWGGEPDNPEREFTGARWMEGRRWSTYQRTTFNTPAFAGYVSGHSTFSRAAAEVLTAMTGSPYFPGGMAIYNVAAETHLEFERGPSVGFQLQWATYYDAADEAGVSRIYGGIHPSFDDLPGRILGSRCGLDAWDLAQKYFDGSILLEAPAILVRETLEGGCEIEWTGYRGLTYVVEASDDLIEFEPIYTTERLEDAQARLAVHVVSGARFFRVRTVNAAAAAL